MENLPGRNAGARFHCGLFDEEGSHVSAGFDRLISFAPYAAPDEEVAAGLDAAIFYNPIYLDICSSLYTETGKDASGHFDASGNVYVSRVVVYVSLDSDDRLDRDPVGQERLPVDFGEQFQSIVGKPRIPARDSFTSCPGIARTGLPVTVIPFSP